MAFPDLLATATDAALKSQPNQTIERGSQGAPVPCVCAGAVDDPDSLPVWQRPRGPDIQGNSHLRNLLISVSILNRAAGFRST